jgi:hypothetical protein
MRPSICSLDGSYLFYLKRLFGLFGVIGKDACRISVNLAGGERFKLVNYSLTGGRWSAIFAYRETRRRCADC